MSPAADVMGPNTCVDPTATHYPEGITTINLDSLRMAEPELCLSCQRGE